MSHHLAGYQRLKLHRVLSCGRSHYNFESIIAHAVSVTKWYGDQLLLSQAVTASYLLQRDAISHLSEPETVVHLLQHQSVWHTGAYMCYSMMPYCICYKLRLCYIGHCVNLCGTQTGHLTVIPFALLFHHLCTASHIYLAGSNLQNLTSQIAEPHKPNCRTSQAKLQNPKSQTAEPHKPTCRTSQAKVTATDNLSLWSISTDMTRMQRAS